MGKYERKVPKKLKRKHPILKVLLIILLILLLLICAVVGYIWTKLDLIQFADEIDNSVYYTEPVEGDPSATEEADEDIVDISGLEMVETEPVIPDSEVMQEDNILNILLIGTDERTKDFSTNARSDSMILVSIDKDIHTVKLVSLERGIAAPVLEGQYAGQYDWLTHIFRYGGADLLCKTVEHCFKIDVDHYVRLNLNSVKNVIDVIGGIDIELTASEAGYLGMFYQQNSTTGSQQPIKTGMNHLDGGNALHYARLRAIDSDWQRVERQRKVILAVVDKLQGSTLTDLNNLADEVLPMIQTNLTKLEIAELVLYAPNFLKSTFDQMTIPKAGTYGGMTVMGGRGSFAIDFEVNNKILHEFLYGTE